MDALRLMAGTPAARNFEEIDRLLSCPICLEVFSKPVVILPCQHNLCRKCANDVFQNRGTPMGSGGRFRCPTCRYEVVLDRHGVYGLQRNLLVENIIDIYQSQERNHSFKKVETLMCEEHEEEKVNIYCVTCQKPTCSLCKVFGQHQNCEVAPMEAIYKEQKKEISDAIASLVTGNDQLQAVIAHIQELGEVTESNGQRIKSELCAAFDQLYSVLEDRKSKMMSRITADVQERNQVLQDMSSSYGKQLEGSSKLMETSLALLEERSVPQFLTLSRDIISKLNTTARSTDVRKPPSNIQDMTEFQVQFDFQKEILSKLDFNAAQEKDFQINDLFVDVERVPQERAVESEDEDCDVTIEVEAVDSDDATSTSQTSRNIEGSNPESCLSAELTDMLHTREQRKTSIPADGASETSSRCSANDENQQWGLWS